MCAQLACVESIARARDAASFHAVFLRNSACTAVAACTSATACTLSISSTLFVRRHSSCRCAANHARPFQPRKCAWKIVSTGAVARAPEHERDAISLLSVDEISGLADDDTLIEEARRRASKGGLTPVKPWSKKSSR